jgi:hypothetical protein
MLAQLGVHNPLPAAEVRKLLKQREQMGLSRSGEAEEFCTVCGVCHTGQTHLPAMRPGQPYREPLPVSGETAVDPLMVRNLVSQVVQKTLGSAY